MIFGANFVEAGIINTHAPLLVLLSTRTGLANHSGKNTVGSGVLAKPSRFEHWGACEDFPPTDPCPNLAKIL